MKNEFGRIITKLRKQKGLSQKDAAQKLGISQSLLSHYEKGIRACGLDFLVKTADFYEVSADYLLGRTNNPSFTTNEVDAIPEVDELSDVGNVKTNTYCLLNRKLITNSAAVIYSILAKINNKKLSKYVTDYLTVCEYNMLRKLYSLNRNNPDDFFGVKSGFSDRYCDAAMMLFSTKIDGLNTEGMNLSKKTMAEEFDDSYASLHQIVINAEKALNQSLKL